MPAERTSTSGPGRRLAFPRRFAVALLPAVLVAAGCWQGRILLRAPAPTTPGEVRASGLSVAVEGVPRMQSDLYQARLEEYVVRAVQERGLFRAVRYPADEARDGELVLRIQPAIIDFDRRPDPVSIPLGLVTFSLYIHLGGPSHTDTEFYDVTLSLHARDGRHLFDVHRREKHTHGINVYHSERGDVCRGPHAGDVIAGLVDELEGRLAELDPPPVERARGSP